MKTLLSVLILSASISACATGSTGNVDKTISSRNITVADFHAIDAATGIKVVYSQGALSPAKVTAPRYLFEYLELDVTRGVLEVQISNRYWKKFNSINGEVTVTVSSPMVNNLDASSGASILINGKLNCKGAADIETSSGAAISMPEGFSATGKVELETSSGSSISVTGLNAPTLEVDLSSGSAMSLTDVNTTSASFDLSSGASCSVSGTTSNLKVDASSGAGFNGKNFRAKTADIEAGSGGSVNYNAVTASVDAGSTGAAKNYH